VFLPLEQALLSRIVDNKRRTWVMARYSLVGTLLAAFGSLAAALPTMAASYAGFSTRAAVQGMFLLYALLALAAGAIYRGLPKALESAAPAPKEALHQSKKTVYTLAALFSLDAFGGGFVVQSLVALWLYQRFGLSVSLASAIFFWTGMLTAFSYLVAARIANRIGLLKTMVFTHLPSSICLILIPFMPAVGYAIALAAAVSPVLAGYLLGLSPFGWAFVAGGAMKIVYDLLLLAMFNKIRPPEEEPAAVAGADSPVEASHSGTRHPRRAG
jgi:predicted MFS family arabinose efflux permease